MPPESTTPTRWPEKSAFLWRTAAAAATPEGSTRTFIRSSIQVSVSIISVVGDEENVRHRLLDDREGQLSGRRHAQAVGDRRVLGDLDALARRERALRVVGGLGLGAVDPDPGPQVPRRRRPAADQAAAATRDDEGVEVGDLLEELHGARRRRRP